MMSVWESPQGYNGMIKYMLYICIRWGGGGGGGGGDNVLALIVH